MFQLFDENGDGSINFTEFICGLSILCTYGTRDEKMQFSFQIYDFDGDGKISRDELGRMLKASLSENDIELTASQTNDLLDATFLEADKDKDGFINFQEYEALVDAHPDML